MTFHIKPTPPILFVTPISYKCRWIPWTNFWSTLPVLAIFGPPLHVCFLIFALEIVTYVPLPLLAFLLILLTVLLGTKRESLPDKESLDNLILTSHYLCKLLLVLSFVLLRV